MLCRATITALCAVLLALAPDRALGGGVTTPDRIANPALKLAGSIAQPPAQALILARHGEPSVALEMLPGEQSAMVVRLLTELKRYRDADSVLALHTPVGDGRELYLHQLQRAALNLLAGRYDAALAALEPIAGRSDAEFDAYRDYIAMRSHLALGAAGEAARVGIAGREQGLPGALQDDYEETLIEACQGAGDEAFALTLTRSLQKRSRAWRDRARHLFTEYEYHVRAGDVESARRVARDIVARYPGFERAADVAGEIRHATGAGTMTERELATYAGFHIRRGELDDAATLLRVLGAHDLSKTGREELQILRAEYHYRSGDYARAIELSKPAFSVASYKRRSVLVLARSYRRTEREDKAARLYEYFARTFPNDAKAAEALFVAARIHERAGDDGAYRRALDALIQGYPSSYYGRTAALLAARRYAGRGEHAAAVAVLERLLRRSRGSDESALYYLSRAYEDAGDKEHSIKKIKELEDLDRFSFYLHPDIVMDARGPILASSGRVAFDGDAGLIAFLERGRREKHAAYQRIREELLDGDAEPEEQFNACIRRGRWFISVGLREWGERELEAARLDCFESPLRMLELGRVYDEYAMPWQSVRMYQRAMWRMPWSRRGEFAGDFLWLLYPTPYPVQVLTNAERYGLPAHLAYAMIREESRFDLEAVSRVGAVGLMQIMPSTGRDIARELELPGWEADDLLSPEVNVAFGVWYASSLLDAGGGDPLQMLAAYNAGPGNARRWFRGGQSAIDRVDGIDFKETRTYVQRIVESANIYHALYFGPDALGSEPPR